MRSVTFVEQFYYPDASAVAQLLTELTVGLRGRGWRVRVVASPDDYARPERPAPVDPERFGVEVYRTPRLTRGPDRVGKLARQLWFYAAAVRRLLATCAPDLYVTQTSPPLMPVLVALVARTKRRPFVIVAQDLYPEAMAAHGMLDPRGRFYRMLRRTIDRAYRRAARVVSLGPCMSRRLAEKGVRGDLVEEIPNWGLGDLGPWEGPNELRREWGLEGRFVVLYSGNMGLGHEFETFLRGVLEARKDCPELAVVFVGAGRRRGEISTWTREHKAEGWILFRPFQPQDRLKESLSVADLSLVTVRRGWDGLLVPSKISGILAVGSPTLYVGPESDVSILLDRFRAGVHVLDGDVEGVRSAILHAARNRSWCRVAGERARAGYAKHLSREAAIERYDKLLTEAAG